MPEMPLHTKLFVPPERPNLISRPKLIEQLYQGLQPGRKLVLISAPAGSGKTTLLSQFVGRSERLVAWLALDRADNDQNRFWRYVIAALQSVVEGMGQSALELLDAPQPTPESTVPIRLINDIAQNEQELLLVLDDYHVIHDPSIHESIAYFLDYLPDNLLLVIATRADPPWSLARYRARNQLIEIRARDLRFNHWETAEFLGKTMSLDLSVEDVTALETRTEGWVAGLQLAAIAIQSLVAPLKYGRVSGFIEAFSGSNLFVAEYLLDEVLAHQEEDLRMFLLQTSILERMNAELCDAVTGGRDGLSMLAALNKANLFTIPLDLEGRWVRYHHLFADLLQARAEQELRLPTITSLHQRAATWYKQNGYIVEAVSHLLAAQAYEQVAALVEQEARSLIFTGQMNTLNGWLADLPEEILQVHPRLQIYRLWIDLMQEKVALSAQALEEKENMLRALPPSPENEQLRVELLAILCRFVAFSGNSARAIRLAEEALQRLPEGDKALRARAYSALAVAYWIDGHAEKARQAYDQCMRLARPSGYYSLAAHATMMMAMSQTDYGQLHDAAATFQSIIDMGGPVGQEMLSPAGQGYIGLAGIHLEWNALETAEALLQQGMALCRRGGLAGLSFGHTIKARLRQAQGDFQGAAAEIERLGHTGVDPSGTSRQILLMVAMGDLDQASRLASPWIKLLEGSNVGPQPPLLILEIIKVTLAQLYLARGELAQAEKLLDDVQATAGPDGRLGRLIEVHLLRAVLYQQGNRDDGKGIAIKSLEQALKLARPQGYTLLFLEQSPAVLPLLQVMRSRKGVSAEVRKYAQQLAEAARAAGTLSTPAPPNEGVDLVEPLTPREMEVLQLVAMGDTNQVIAETLFISVRTVKKHITNILGKLGVSNRTQAVVRAREVGLIPHD
jgi:LuxR family maltose regulon positive regulatory protein